MNRLGSASASFLGWLLLASTSGAQTEAPPAPTSEPPAEPSTYGATPPSSAPPPASPPSSAPRATPSGRVQGRVSADVDYDLEASDEEEDTESESEETPAEARLESLKETLTLQGSTGLLRVSQAGSGAPGTLRIALLSSFFTGSGVLCTEANPCPVPPGSQTTPSAADNLDQVGAHLGISATLFPFLEAYFGFHNRSTSNSRGARGHQLLQVLGDTNFGVKGFLPRVPDRIFSFGGEAELWLLNSTGQVGIAGGGTSFALRALGSLDLSNRSRKEDRFPLRAHLNLGYHFDNSGNIVDDLEQTRRARISRIERFSLDIDRTDSFELGIGAEYVNPYVRPFLEWTLDAPVNRQGYVCNIDNAESRGESCLKLHQDVSAAPSRLTIGARAFPWPGRGLSALAAFDIGTGATSTFIEEVAPEVPWSFWFGLGWAVDTQPPKPVIERVPVAPKAPVVVENFIHGLVKERGTETPIPDAIVRYDGRSLTGMVTDANGAFRTGNLPPDTYTFKVSANGYREGECSATIPKPVPPRTATSSAPARPAPGPSQAKGSTVSVVCELEALPRVGSVAGLITDTTTNEPVASARIQIVDKLGRKLDLQGDASGQFLFENVPPGRAKLTIDAPGYFTNVTELDVEARKENPARISMNKRPTQPNVVVQGNEVKLKKQVHFQHDSAEILPDSMALLEEIADVLKTRPEIGSIEVQGHTDDVGNPAYNQRLSQNRAEAVVAALELLGVTTGRLTPKGYGPDKPIVPNTNDQNRARNRRVQLIIQK